MASGELPSIDEFVNQSCTILAYRQATALTVSETILQREFGPNGSHPVTGQPFRVFEGLVAHVHFESNRQSREKIVMLNSIKGLLRNVLGDSRNEVMMAVLPFPGRRVSRIAYGPVSRQCISTSSHELIELFALSDDLLYAGGEDPEVNVQSIDRVRILYLDCELGNVGPEHMYLAGQLLTDGFIKHSLMDIREDGKLAPVTHDESRVLIDHPAGMADQITDFMCGTDRGGAADFFILHNESHILFEGRGLKTICVGVRAEFWYANTASAQQSARYIIDHSSHVRSMACFGNRCERSSVQLNRAFYLRDAPLSMVALLGKIFLLSTEKTPAEVRYNISQYLHLRMTLDVIRTSGCALCCGFYRPIVETQSEIFESDPPEPVLFESYIQCEHVPKFRLHSVCEEITTSNPRIFALGYFFDELLPAPSLRLTHHESGRDVGVIKKAMMTIMETIDNRLIRGVSQGSVSSTHLEKLLSFSGGRGVILEAECLPEYVKKRLAMYPQTEADRVHNRETLRHFLLESHSVVYIAVASCGHFRTDAAVQEIAATFFCSCFSLGELDRQSSGVVVKFPPNPEHPNMSELREMVAPDVAVIPFAPCVEVQACPRPASIPVLELELNLEDSLTRILQHPSVGSKEFIVRHIDRFGSGNVIRSQGVGPYDLPVSDYASLCFKFTPFDQFDISCWRLNYPGTVERKYYSELPLSGICTALGERTPLFNLDHALGIKVAITEALFNLSSANISTDIASIVVSLSITWPNYVNCAAEIVEIVRIASSFCAEIGVNFHVDTANSSTLALQSVKEPAAVKSVVARATSTSSNLMAGLTPALVLKEGTLLLISVSDDFLHKGSTMNLLDNFDLTRDAFNIDPVKVNRLMTVMSIYLERGLIYSAHDISDGGLWVALCEMALAGGRSMNVLIPGAEPALLFLTSETPGVLVETTDKCATVVGHLAVSAGLSCRVIAGTWCSMGEQSINVRKNNDILLRAPLKSVYSNWSLHSRTVQSHGTPVGGQQLVDEPFSNNMEIKFSPYRLTLSPAYDRQVWVIAIPGAPPPTSIMMALIQSGFAPRIIDLSKVETIEASIERVSGIVIYGDTRIEDSCAGDRTVANFASKTHSMRTGFRVFCKKANTWTLGIGSSACELMFQLKLFGYNMPTKTTMFCKDNVSGRFECRWLNFAIPSNTTAKAFKTLKGSLIPCWALGSRLGFDHKYPAIFARMKRHGQVAACFYGSSSGDGEALTYPRNPTGGPTSTAGVCSADGRCLGLLFDPSLAFHRAQWPDTTGGENRRDSVSPWKMMFYDLYEFTLSRSIDVFPVTNDPVYSDSL